MRWRAGGGEVWPQRDARVWRKQALSTCTGPRPLCRKSATHLLHVLGAARLVGVQQRRHDDDGARRVQHVDDGVLDVAVLRPQLDGRVHARRRRAADEQRQVHARLAHLLGDKHHLVQRRRDEARQAHHVHAVLLGGGDDLVARHHDANVDDLVVVAAQHDAHDVLADVVHVAFDGRQQDLACVHGVVVARRRVLARGNQRRALLRLHVRDQVRDRLLHHARRLDHLWAWDGEGVPGERESRGRRWCA
jgi:hypothetical protein